MSKIFPGFLLCVPLYLWIWWAYPPIRRRSATDVFSWLAVAFAPIFPLVSPAFLCPFFLCAALFCHCALGNGAVARTNRLFALFLQVLGGISLFYAPLASIGHGLLTLGLLGMFSFFPFCFAEERSAVDCPAVTRRFLLNALYLPMVIGGWEGIGDVRIALIVALLTALYQSLLLRGGESFWGYVDASLNLSLALILGVSLIFPALRPHVALLGMASLCVLTVLVFICPSAPFAFLDAKGLAHECPVRAVFLAFAATFLTFLPIVLSLFILPFLALFAPPLLSLIFVFFAFVSLEALARLVGTLSLRSRLPPTLFAAIAPLGLTKSMVGASLAILTLAGCSPRIRRCQDFAPCPPSTSTVPIHEKCIHDKANADDGAV
jgi:hypothetical protein